MACTARVEHAKSCVGCFSEARLLVRVMGIAKMVLVMVVVSYVVVCFPFLFLGLKTGWSGGGGYN